MVFFNTSSFFLGLRTYLGVVVGFDEKVNHNREVAREGLPGMC